MPSSVGIVKCNFFSKWYMEGFLFSASDSVIPSHFSRTVIFFFLSFIRQALKEYLHLLSATYLLFGGEPYLMSSYSTAKIIPFHTNFSDFSLQWGLCNWHCWFWMFIFPHLPVNWSLKWKLVLQVCAVDSFICFSFWSLVFGVFSKTFDLNLDDYHFPMGIRMSTVSF